MSIIKGLLGIALLLIIAGCRDYSDTAALPYKGQHVYGHPAHPESQAGRRENMSRTLRPQNQNVQPEIAAAPPPKTRNASQISAIKTMDHSSHRGSH